MSLGLQRIGHNLAADNNNNLSSVWLGLHNLATDFFQPIIVPYFLS